MVRIERSPNPPPGWDSLCEEEPRATLFLHPRWMEAMLRAYPRYRPLYLVAMEGGTVSGGIPVVRMSRLGTEQFLSMPFGSHGGPLLAPGADPEAARALAREFRELGTGLRTLRFEMSVFDPPATLREAMAGPLGFSFQDFRTHVVDLRPGFEELWRNGYRRGTRKCVRAARRAGVEIHAQPAEEGLNILAELHGRQSRSWEGVHPYSGDALAAIAGVYGLDARIYAARRDGETLAACLFLTHGGREILPLVSGAVPDAREHRAFHLLMHDAMRDACEAGFTVWSFGGSGGNREIEFFKESFGAVPRSVLRCFHMPAWAKRLGRRPAWDR